MVELYSLKLLGDLTGIDADVAQLEFESSLIDQSLNLGIDPTLISTDSLDIEKIHLRCETNKNDYKITFEDSGQWTSIANSPDDIYDDEIDENNLTTWGRIKSTEPFNEKTNSLPELKDNISPITSPIQQPKRPSSLVANFVEKQPDGKVLDVNDNEIGYIPESTASLQKTKCLQQKKKILKPPRRTFADLDTSIPRDDSGIERTPVTDCPELTFLTLPFEVPSFCQENNLKNNIPTLDDLIKQTKQIHLSHLNDKNLDQKMTECLSSDNNCYQQTPGPSHIEDWPSLAFLLPKNVVDTCNYLKSNSHLLINSTTKNTQEKNRLNTIISKNSSTSSDSGIDSSRTKRNNYNYQTQSLFYPSTATTTTTSSLSSTKLSLSSKIKLHAKELSIIGLPIYKSKRLLVEDVVEGVAEIARGSSSNILVESLEKLLSDGLNDCLTCWDMIESVTAPGPATSNVYQIVKDLGISEKPKNSLTHLLFKELLRLRSLDGWLSYIVLKENVLSRLYSKDAFILNANTSYRSLFWRLIESLELLSIIEQKPKQKRDRGDSGMGVESWGSASRIASDSRVPKSSSIPSKLVNETSTSTITKVERPETLNIQIPRTPSPRLREATVSKIAAVSPSPSNISNNSSTTSLKRSRIPVPNSSPSPATSTTSSRLRTPSFIVSKTLGSTTNSILNQASSPTQLPLYRRTQYGSRAISQQRPLTTTCRYESRRPMTTTTTNRNRKYY